MPAIAAINGKIGPNAITRVIEALRALESPTAVDRIFQACELQGYLCDAPADMVDEREVTRLHDVLHRELGTARARGVGRIAGQLTADYLLGFRIPRLAQMALRCCPAGVSSRLLAKAIARNSWTFAGTGTFSVRHGRPATFEVKDCPICRGRRSSEPCCDFYAATFERLYRRLVDQRARVIEVGCQAKGASACTFEMTW
ncbi:MAG TPA: bacteriochlorophyll 4-vinyl reductase [Bradyrhizobium sp.]|nr:bacteriochlorophyll 4-vinyl reductase [Bradyrhizobium sp.]